MKEYLVGAFFMAAVLGLAGAFTMMDSEPVTPARLERENRILTDSLALLKAVIIVQANEKEALRDSIVTLHWAHNNFALRECKR